MTALAATAGLLLTLVPLVWTGPHPFAVSLAVFGVFGVGWTLRRSHPSNRTIVALVLLGQTAAAHRLGVPPTWWPVAAAVLLFLFLDLTGGIQERREAAPGSAVPELRRLLLLGAVVMGSAAVVEGVVTAGIGSGLLPTVAAVAGVAVLVLGAAHLVGRRVE